MNAVIYARYSCDNQREESIDGQVRECMEFAKRKGYDVIATYADKAKTGTNDKRPQFQQMIKDSFKHQFNFVIVWKLDRFSRNKFESAFHKYTLKNNGVKVISATEALSDSPEGIILESVLEGMAEYYSIELSVKVIRGMKENAIKGINNGGPITFGYQLNAERKYELSEIYAPIVQEIYTMYADGQRLVDIVNYLDQRHIRNYRNKKLNSNAVQRILSNRRYLGELRFHDIVNPNAFPAIISEELFERVQRQLKINKKAPARRKAEDNYILSTKLFCGKCGMHMVGESGMGTSRVYRYYKCANTKRVHTCDKKSIRKELIENLVIKTVLEILDDDKLVNYLANKIYSLQGEVNPRIPVLKKQLQDTENRITNIMEAIEQGAFTDTTRDRLLQLEHEKRELETAISKEEISNPLLSLEQILEGIKQYKQLDLNSLEGKERLIDCFINSIYLYDDRVVITFNFKNETRTIFLSEINATYNSNIKCIGAPRRRLGTNQVAFFHT